MLTNRGRLALITAVLGITVAACTGSTSGLGNDQALTDQQLRQYQLAQPVPFFDWSMDRQALIDIYQAKNEQRTTWAVVTSQGTGQILFTCPSLSYPIPADTQLTNPEQLQTVWAGNAGGSSWHSVDGVVGQMEPNGVYTSSNTDATYVLCLRPNGKVSPVYTEQEVTLFPFEVKVVDGVIVDAGGSSSIEVNLTKPDNVPLAPSATK